MHPESTSTTHNAFDDSRPSKAVGREGAVHDQDTDALLRRLIGSRPVDTSGQPLQLDVEAFHAELRQRNASIVFWTAVIFNPLYVSWCLFDRVLVPDDWLTLLVLRVTAAVCITVVTAIVLRTGSRRSTFEAFWIIVMLYAGFVALMFPLATGALLPYLMGFSIILLGAGILPVWPPRWAVTAMSGALSVAAVVGIGSPEIRQLPPATLVTGIFVVATAVFLSLVASTFKYDLARRDFLNRMELAAVAQRESEARQRLAETSTDLQSALEKLKTLDRLKSEFFANISHELRTPLTLIVAPVDQLVHTIDDSYAREQLRIVLRNAERLLWLINDLLDLARLDAGGLRLNLDAVNIRSIAATVRENTLPAATTKRIDLRLETDSSDRAIWADAHRLEIVLTNLVSNAVKFTPPAGRVLMRIADGADGVEVSIEDDGPGIPEKDLPRVFERFFQVGQGDRRREGGVGIGLALAKELVELHGGSISVDSRLGRGTTFKFAIPFGKGHVRPDAIERRRRFVPDRVPQRRRYAKDASSGVPSAPVAAPQAAPEDLLHLDGQRPARILLVEDNEQVRGYISSLLAPLCDLTTAVDGEDAMLHLRSDPPDLVVSDVMMPKLEGTDLCRAIKSDPALRSIPVILLTARVGSEATLDAYAHGADDFVAKPFHPQVLLARIRAQLKLRSLGLQLAQREKLSAVGTLAAGVLHEVRNPVNAILNAARVMAQGTADPATTRNLLDVIQDGATRIDGIAGALDAHVRPAEDGGPNRCDVHVGIDSTLRLLAYRMAEVTVHRDDRADVEAAIAPARLNQVLLNLMENAVAVGARTLWIQTGVSDQTVTISIGDDGPGVRPEHESRVFDAFFTQRPDGSGTGLGLYLSRQIITAAGGNLTLDRRDGGGAEFTVEIPTVDRDGDPDNHE